jgi:hypothetical protein
MRIKPLDLDEILEADEENIKIPISAFDLQKDFFEQNGKNYVVIRYNPETIEELKAKKGHKTKFSKQINGEIYSVYLISIQDHNGKNCWNLYSVKNPAKGILERYFSLIEDLK